MKTIKKAFMYFFLTMGIACGVAALCGETHQGALSAACLVMFLLLMFDMRKPNNNLKSKSYV